MTRRVAWADIGKGPEGVVIQCSGALCSDLDVSLFVSPSGTAFEENELAAMKDGWESGEMGWECPTCIAARPVSASEPANAGLETVMNAAVNQTAAKAIADLRKKVLSEISRAIGTCQDDFETSDEEGAEYAEGLLQGIFVRVQKIFNEV